MLPEDPNNVDFCRVCRCEATASRPLFYPCMCTGSIKFVHQDCLLQWLRYSERQTCELCNHPFKFAPIYASGTPRFIPLRVLFAGLLRNLRLTVAQWFHLGLVFSAWLVVVPLTACRIYRCLFTGSLSALLTLPLDMVSTRHLLQDCLQGFTIVFLALAAFIGYTSLRERLLQGGLPEWLGRNAPEDEADLVDDDGGHPPFFPDLFNLFGAPNAAGHAAEPVFENNANAEPDTAVHQPTESSSEDILAPGADDATHVTGESSSESTGEPLHLVGAELPTEHGDEPNPAEHPGGVGGGGDGLGVAGDEDEAAAAGEAMNWDRLLGLDGSFAFLEHVLWLIALNTLFIVMFAFCPYHIGQLTVLGFNLDWMVTWTHMDGLATSLIGYVVSAGALVLFHYGFKYFAMPRASYWFGLGYVYVKVALVLLLEVGILPILYGFWIDACTLPLFNATLPARLAAFHYAPMTFTFMHLAVGMLHLFYMASFLILARGVLRPGVLRFIYHFNDPEYKPIQDMIAQPLTVYMQRLVANFSIWGILIVFMLWIPVELVRRSLPGFLPFRLTSSHESPFDYSVEIVLIQGVLPFLLDAQAKATVRQSLHLWCIAVGSLLGIRSYLIGDVPFKKGDLIVNEDGDEVPHVPPEPSNTAADTTSIEGAIQPFADANPLPPPPPPPAAAAAPPRPDDPDEVNRYVPYAKPPLFALRMLGFGLLLLLSLIVTSIVLLVAPVGLGRFVFHLVGSPRLGPRHDAVAIAAGVTLLSLGLRLAICIPLVVRAAYQPLASLFSHVNRQFSQAGAFRVLRVWTRSGTTCEIPIPRRRALPAPAPLGPNLASSPVEILNLTRTTLRTFFAGAQHVLVRLSNLAGLAGVAVLFFGVLPVALGLWINLTFIIPLQVDSEKTLVIGLWEYWIFGIMHLKVAGLLTLAGPPWWFRRRLDAVQHELVQRGFRARSLFLLSQLAPLAAAVGLSLSVPYLLAYHGSVWFSLKWQFAFRYIYPGLVAVSVLIGSYTFVLHQLITLYHHIKDENYLVGRRLVNFATPNAAAQ